MARMPVLGVTASPEPATAVEETPDDGWGAEPRRRRWLVALLVVVIVLVLAGLVAGGLLLAAPSPTPSPSRPVASHSVAPPSPSTSASPSPSPTPSASASPTPTATTSPSTAPSPSPTSAPASGSPTSSELADAIRTYFALLPGNTDAAWNRLTPSFQQGHAQGRAYFDSFWGDYRSVTATDVQGAAPDQASATLTYVAKDGTRTVERDTFRLVRQDGVLKIDAESTG
jgi:hypothetical protein